VISAPSGGGKTTLIKELMSHSSRIRHSISYTTRPQRTSGSDHKDYHFISDDEFERMIEKEAFLEWAEVHGYRYGTCRDDLENLRSEGFDVLMDIDIQGAKILRSMMPDAIFIFVMPPSLSILKSRLTERASESPEDLKCRLRNAEREMAEYRRYDYVVINDDLDTALENVRSICRAERCKVTRKDDILQVLSDD
jgi:guanylate kinase